MDFPFARTTLSDAAIAVTGEALSLPEMCTLLAHSSHETGAWSKVANWNWGGIKWSPGHDWAFHMTTEGYGATAKRLPQKFRAYPEAIDGAKDFVHFIYARPAAYTKLNDPAAYSQGLRDCSYFTGEPAAYLASLQRHWGTIALRLLGLASVKDFQASTGLTADGIVGPITRAALLERLRKA